MYVYYNKIINNVAIVHTYTYVCTYILRNKPIMYMYVGINIKII